MRKNIDKLKGMHTIETFAEKTGLKNQSALNLISRLKKEGYVKVSGGGRQKRIYMIYNKKIAPENGLFQIINKYSKIKIAPIFVHVVHDKYTIEDAIIDALKTKDFRTIFASLYLYQKIKDWKKLYAIAKKNEMLAMVISLRELAKRYLKISAIPKRFEKKFSVMSKKKSYIVENIESHDFEDIAKTHNVAIPFSKSDMGEMT